MRKDPILKKVAWFKAILRGKKVIVDLGAFDAVCSNPKGEIEAGKEPEASIMLPKGFKPDKYTMELLLHESWHICDWSASEEKVEESAHDIVEGILWRLYMPREKTYRGQTLSEVYKDLKKEIRYHEIDSVDDVLMMLDSKIKEAKHR